MATVLNARKSADASRQEAIVEKQLAQAESRIRRLDWLLGALVLTALTLTFTLTIVLLDRTFILSDFARQIGLFTFGGLFALTGWFALVRPLLRRINPYYAARKVEKSITDAKNSLVNYLDLRDEELSPAIRNAVSQRAARDIQTVDVDDAIRGRQVFWLGWVVGGLALTALIVLLLLRPSQFFSLLSRAFAPFEARAIATRTQLEMVLPKGGDTTVILGQSVFLQARVDGRIPEAKDSDAMKLHIRYNQTDETTIDMPLEVGNDTYTWQLRLPARTVQNGLWYRITGGDATTAEYRINVKSLPLFESFEVRYDYPPYLRWDAQTASKAGCQDPIQAIRGTWVTLTAHTNRTIQDAKLIIDQNKPIVGEKIAGFPLATRFKFQIDQDASYRIFFTSVENESNSDPKAYSIRSLTDMLPRIEWIEPEADEIELPANDVLKMKALATDDFGLDKLTLNMQIVEPQMLSLKSKPYRGGKSFLREEDQSYPTRLEYKGYVDLAKLQNAEGQAVALQEGMVIEYWLEAGDNCKLVDAFNQPIQGDRIGKSVVRRVRIVPPKMEKEQKEQLDQKREKLEQDQQQHEKKQDQQLQQEKRDRQQPQPEEQPQQGDPDQQKEPMNGEPKQNMGNGEGQPMPNQNMGNGEGQPMPMNGEPMPMKNMGNGQPMNGDPMPMPNMGDPMPMNGDPMPMKNMGNPMPMPMKNMGNGEGQPMPNPDKNMGNGEGQPMPMNGDPMPMKNMGNGQGQPMKNMGNGQGQPMNGDPMPNMGDPMPMNGDPMPPKNMGNGQGQPMPMNGQEPGTPDEQKLKEQADKIERALNPNDPMKDPMGNGQPMPMPMNGNGMKDPMMGNGNPMPMNGTGMKDPMKDPNKDPMGGNSQPMPMPMNGNGMKDPMKDPMSGGGQPMPMNGMKDPMKDPMGNGNPMPMTGGMKDPMKDPMGGNGNPMPMPMNGNGMKDPMQGGAGQPMKDPNKDPMKDPMGGNGQPMPMNGMKDPMGNPMPMPMNGGMKDPMKDPMGNGNPMPMPMNGGMKDPNKNPMQGGMKDPMNGGMKDPMGGNGQPMKDPNKDPMGNGNGQPMPMNGGMKDPNKNPMGGGNSQPMKDPNKDPMKDPMGKMGNGNGQPMPKNDPMTNGEPSEELKQLARDLKSNDPKTRKQANEKLQEMLKEAGKNEGSKEELEKALELAKEREKQQPMPMDMGDGPPMKNMDMGDGPPAPMNNGGGPNGKENGQPRNGEAGNTTDNGAEKTPIDEEAKRRASELQLEQFKKNADNEELLKNLNMTKEEYQNFLKSYEKMMQRKLQGGPDVRDDMKAGNRSGNSSTNQGAQRIETGNASNGDTNRVGPVFAPSEFRNPFKQFSDDLSRIKSPKK